MQALEETIGKMAKLPEGQGIPNGLNTNLPDNLNGGPLPVDKDAPTSPNKDRDGNGLNIKYTAISYNSTGSRETKKSEAPNLIRSDDNNTGPTYELFYIKSNTKEDITEIEVSGQGLKKLMWSAIEGFIEHCGNSKRWKSAGKVKISTGASALLHNWQQLQTLSQSDRDHSVAPSDTTDYDTAHLKQLLNDVEALQTDRIRACENLSEAKIISFTNILYLFTPGKYMVAFPFLDQPQLFQIDTYYYKPKDEFTVGAWAYDWNGSSLERRQYKFSIRMFEDDRRINELPFYPVDYFEDETKAVGLPALRRKMKDRAEKFREYCRCEKGRQLFSYEGVAMIPDRHAEDSRAFQRTDRQVFNASKVCEYVLSLE